MKFRKKPIIVEAEQWFVGKQIRGVYFGILRGVAYIDTEEGKMSIREGDWIITGIEGETYCCKDSIFKKTYEAIDEKI